jgi:hypothetical protein
MEKPTDDLSTSVSIQHAKPTAENAALLMFGLLSAFNDIAEQFPDLVRKVEVYARADAFGNLGDAVEDPHYEPDAYLHRVTRPGLECEYASLDPVLIPPDVKESLAAYDAKYPARILHTVSKLREIGTPVEVPYSTIAPGTPM